MESSRAGLDMSYESRLSRFTDVSTHLALLSNQRLRERLENVSILGTGIGGRTALMQFEGTSIFVKILPLTELEKHDQNVMSTRNVFEVPPYCQYGIGGPPRGVWREIAAHTMTTNWVLAGQCDSFPLIYHWRVLPNLHTPLSEEIGDIPSMVEYWNSEAVGELIEAIEQSVDSVVLFCEYIPHNLHDWMNEQVAIGNDEANSAFEMVESQLRSAVSFMNSQGLLHFDVHFKNILTDGHRIYITDFGLATSSQFELSDSEWNFFELNQAHDECYAVTHFVNWLVAGLMGLMDRTDRIDFIRRCADGYDPTKEVGSVAAGIITRYAPIAAVINDFYTNLRVASRATPFPIEQIQRVSEVNDRKRSG